MQTKERAKSGTIASIVGILVNILVAAAKMIAGALFGIISLLADGINNLTDCGSSVISLISFRLSSKPADKEHPYGHERIEYVCSMVVAFIILIIATTLMVESINKIITPSELTFSLWIVLSMVFSLIAKIGLFVYYKITAKKINSSILNVSAIDSLTDCISTITVLIAFIIGITTGVNVDGYIGILVALIIGISGIRVLKDVFSTLIGKAPDPEVLDKIKQKVLSYPNVLGIHDVAVYNYGPNKYFASVHVEVDAKEDILISHELVDEIEKDFANTTNIILTGHLDPIVTDDERVNTLRKKVEQIVVEIDKTFSIHDFRMVFGVNHTNVLFDVAIPFDCKLCKEQIREILDQKLKEIDEKYCLVVTIEPTL